MRDDGCPTPPYAPNVQRLFSTFPHGAPGIGLLLLRISVAVQFLAFSRAGPSWFAGQSALVGAAAACLIVGAMTPSLAIVCITLELTGLFSTTAASGLTVTIATAYAIALVLLGPGAYSVDARIFGRRVVVVAHGRESPDRHALGWEAQVWSAIVRICAMVIFCLTGASGFAAQAQEDLSQQPLRVEQARVVPDLAKLPVIDGKDLRFTRLSVAQGLSQTRVAQIVQ